jgi:hypothetical protein
VSDAGRHAASPNRARLVTRRAAAVAMVAVALVPAALIAACGDDGDGGNGATGTTSTVMATSTTTVDPEAEERQAVIDAYLAAEEAAIGASAAPVPDPNDNALLETHTGLILDRRQETIRGLRANGWALDGFVAPAR